MSHDYKLVTWTPFKKRFDAWMLVGIAAYLIAFVIVSSISPASDESFTPIQVLMRATGTLAFGLLVLILSIGPLARLTDRFKPFLYNRRHLGVTCFLIALVHAGLVLLWYHGFASVNPFVSLFASNPRYDSLNGFPFESLGFVALMILFLMAATSHDFWNANLGPGLWKAIHMSVYVAFTLLIAHVLLGALQFEKSPLYHLLIIGAATWIAGLHLWTGFATTGPPLSSAVDGWIRLGPALDIEESRAKIVRPEIGEAIAVFRNGDEVVAVSNVCRHQGGPLGEGKIVDGCITCPWHGFQYGPNDGQSPPPFNEKIATYATKIIDGDVYVNPEPAAPGTQQTPSRIGA